MNARTGTAKAPQLAATPARRGRPRDPEIEVRVYDASLKLYGDHGWPGFNFDGVARLAGVGKDALYRRWEDRGALLNEALRERWAWLETIDEGSLRGDLIAFGRMTLNVFAGPYGDVALQLRADTRRFPEVRAFAEPYRESTTRVGRAVIHRAIDRGELPTDTNAGLIMDLLIGGVINRITSTPQRLKAQMLSRADLFICQSVDVILNGLRSVDRDEGR
jgi:AcrR family transcriptional regulator